MFRKAAGPFVFLLLVSVMAGRAHAAVIDFDNYFDLHFDPGETYTEDGFTFAVVSGSTWAIRCGYGNPPCTLVAGLREPVGIGDTISVTAVDGGLFTFDAVDFGSALDGFLSDGVDFLGLENGVQTQALTGVASSSFTFATANPNFSGPIDELQIVGASQADMPLDLDNFVLTPVRVAEPATLTLFAFGLAGLGAIGRQRQPT